MKFSFVALTTLAGLTYAAPAPSLSDLFHSKNALAEIEKFNEQVSQAGKSATAIMSRYPLPLPKDAGRRSGTPYADIVSRSLTDRIKVREFEFDVRSATSAEDTFFYNTYKKQLTTGEQNAKLSAEDNAKAELAAMQRFSSADLSERLPPSLFDKELKEYVNVAKDEAAKVSRMSSWASTHKGILGAKQLYLENLSAGVRDTMDGQKVYDSIWVEQQRLKAYERMAGRYQRYIEQKEADKDAESE